MKRNKSQTVNYEEIDDGESEEDANADIDGKIEAASTPARPIIQQQLPYAAVTPDHQRLGDQRMLGPDVTIDREKLKPPSSSRKFSNYKDHGDNRLYTLQINSINRLRQYSDQSIKSLKVEDPDNHLIERVLFAINKFNKMGKGNIAADIRKNLVSWLLLEDEVDDPHQGDDDDSPKQETTKKWGMRGFMTVADL